MVDLLWFEVDEWCWPKLRERRRCDGFGLLLGFMAVVLLRWNGRGCVLEFEVSVWFDGMGGLVMGFFLCSENSKWRG